MPKRLILSVLLVTAFGGAIFAADDDSLFKQDKLSTITAHMHEIYEHFVISGELIKKKEYEDAIIHLEALKYYVELMSDNIPKKNKDGSKINKKLYKKNAKALDKLVEKSIKALKEGKPENLPPSDPVVKTCNGCHKDANIPKPW